MLSKPSTFFTSHVSSIQESTTSEFFVLERVTRRTNELLSENARNPPVSNALDDFKELQLSARLSQMEIASTE